MSQKLIENSPMIATYSRMVLASYFVWLISVGDDPKYRVLSFSIFLFAALTDWADGFLSRRFNCSTTMGKFLDPVADKILVTAGLFALLSFQQVDYYLVFLLVARDFFIGGLRSIAASKNIILQAQSIGKVKTALQMGCIATLLIRLPIEPLNQLAYLGLWLSVLLSLLSAVQYNVSYLRQSRS